MTIYAETFENLCLGVNLQSDPARLRAGESPFLQNLTWYGGALRCRRGQVEIGSMLPGAVCCAPMLFHGWLIGHVGRRLLAFKLEREHDAETAPGSWRSLLSAPDFPETPGTFLPYRDALLYKTRGAYARITWDAQTDALRGALLRDTMAETNAYVPVIQLNTDPETGAGDLYQPENRLCGDKIVRFTPNGAKTYHLPVREVDLIRAVKVNGTEVPDWTADLAAGTVQFSAAPEGGANSVEIRYRKENPALFQSVMDCAAAAVFGASQGLCVVAGGGAAQPNAWFWSGHNSAAMDPTYFPESQYNLAGDASDPITAFGCQQNLLVVFQERGLGCARFSLAEVSGRMQIAMDYARISAAMGCDLPGSVQLIENHLVWCSRRYGVCRLESSSAALENEVRVLSRKLHGSGAVQGLLHRLQRCDAASVRSADTGGQYLLAFGQEAYEWNYAISSCADPAWFYHKGIRGVGFAVSGEALYALLSNGAVAAFERCCMDFDGAIEKILTLPPRSLGAPDRQKNVKSVLFTTRSEGECNTRVIYTCDGAQRTDPTNLVSGSWRLWPRDLTRRSLGCQPFERVFRRHPGFHNINHLGIRLENREAGMDLSLVSARILYTLRGRAR